MGRSVSIFGKRFVLFILLSGLIMLPSLVLPLLNPEFEGGKNFEHLFSGHSNPYLRLWVMVRPVLQTLAQASVIAGAFADMNGGSVRIDESLRLAFRRFFPVIGIVVYQGFGFLIGLLLLIVPGFILMAMLYVVLPVCIIEQKGALNSVNRSAALTRGSRWKVFGLILVTTFGGAILVGIVGTVARAALGSTFYTFASYFSELIYLSFTAIVAVLVYYDLRVAKEGPGIEQFSAVFD